MQVQGCPRDVFNDKACMTLKALGTHLYQFLNTQQCGMWAGHLSLLDFIPLVHDHLRALESLAATADPSRSISTTAVPDKVPAELGAEIGLPIV